MTPAPWSVCKYYLQGRCNRPRCKYRHTVPGLVVVNQVPLLDEDKTREMALLVDGHIKATFAAGVVPVQVTDLHGSHSGLRIESVNTSVLLNWSPTTRTLLLQYDSASAASRAWTNLHRARVMDVSLNCALNVDGLTLQINDLPWKISIDMVLNELSAELRTHKDNVKAASTCKRKMRDLEFIRETVFQLAELNPTHIKECSKHVSRTVKLSFASQRLEGVARALDGQRPMQFGGVRIEAFEMVEVQLALDAAIYLRYRGLLKHCAHGVHRSFRCNVHFDEENTMPGAPFQLLLSGTDRAALIAAKSALDKVLMHNAAGRLSPPPKLSRQTHRIVLSKPSDYTYATAGGGLRRAQQKFGNDIVSLDTASSPAAIAVRGDTRILREVQRSLQRSGVPQLRKMHCEVCWDEDDDFVKVKECGHVACKGCFVQYCTLSKDNKFPLQCFQTNCKTLLLLDEVRLAIGEQAFHRLLSEAIEAHFRQDPAAYIKCPGADCASYFSGTGNGEHTCPSCFTISCPQCKVDFHFDETCEQYQERMTGDQKKLQEWMEKAGAKYCPRCSAIVQKDFGCNHMTCGLCGQHFCFACLKMFDDGQGVYDHMAAEHDGYYANGQEGDEANEPRDKTDSG